MITTGWVHMNNFSFLTIVITIEGLDAIRVLTLEPAQTSRLALFKTLDLSQFSSNRSINLPKNYFTLFYFTIINYILCIIWYFLD